ncbi:hypothetical protein K2X92_03910 [Candidatus Gracilibacteria bacterium]|nr:hypothetical protein [Candidatus Gracilibacteria bacterium]
MANYIFFGMYLFVVLGLFGFIAIFMLHIRDYQQYSRYLKTLTRIYILAMVLIASVGGYYLLTGTIFPQNKSTIKRINL